MKWKKWLIILGIVLVIAGACIGYKVMRGYWKWSVPRSLLERIDFDRLIENTDAMLADGYEDITESRGMDPAIYTVLYKRKENAEQSSVRLTMVKDPYYSEPWIGIWCEGSTSYIPYPDLRSKPDLLYSNCVSIDSDMGRISLMFNTKHPLDGRRQAIDFLNDLCDKYCAPSDG